MNQPDPANLNEPFGDSEQLPPAEAQPVAWRVLWNSAYPETCELTSDGGRLRKIQELSRPPHIQPLYAHPPPSPPVGVPKVPVPTDVMEARAQGRAEALAIVLGLEAETVLEELIQSIPTGPAGEWGCAWDEAKLRELFRADDTAWSLLQEAEGDYWTNLGLREEAQRLAQQPAAVDEAMVERAGRAWCAGTDTPFDQLPDAGKARCLEDMRVVLTAALAAQDDVQ